jgi:hypothetical protein
VGEHEAAEKKLYHANTLPRSSTIFDSSWKLFELEISSEGMVYMESSGSGVYGEHF